MNKENEYWNGLFVGVIVSSIFWCTAWSILVAKIDKVHKQDIDYYIEKHLAK